jgi:predicted branched-subunit amino acid permease
MPSSPTLAARTRALVDHPQFRRGVNDMLPMVPGIAAWGLVTGVAMVKSGLSIPLSLLMSFVVYAGSAQLAALPLLATGAPLWVVWLTALIVNLRFVIYSAQWRQYFGHLKRRHKLALSYVAADLNYVLFMKAWPEPQPQPGQVHYFAGGVAVIWLSWQVPSVLGIVFAEAIPTHWGLGFAGTIALIGLAGSLLVDRATWACAAVAATAAIAAFALPFKLHIVVAVAAAIAAGVLMERPGPPGGRLRAVADAPTPEKA